jgi:hypothetical protein
MHDWRGGLADTVSSALVEEAEQVVGWSAHGRVDDHILINTGEIALHLSLLMLEHASDRPAESITSCAWDLSSMERSTNVGALMADASVVVEGLASERDLEGVDLRHCECVVVVVCLLIMWYCGSDELSRNWWSI